MYNNRVSTCIPEDGINAKAHRREKHFMEEWTLISFDETREPEYRRFLEHCTVRIYGSSSGAANYACVWCNGLEASGSGRATGYGYHRPSEAVEIAFKAAGVTFEREIGGRGDTAITEALEALAKHLELNNYYIHHANP